MSGLPTGPFADAYQSVMTPEMLERFEHLLADAMEQILTHGFVMLRDGDREILLDYRDR